MNTDVRYSVVDNIYDDWLDTAQEDICFNLLDYIIGLDPANHYHLTYSSLHNVVGLKTSSEELLLAVQYFCSKKIGLLKLNLEYIEDESNCYPLEVDEDSIELYHPETGELITDMSRVCHYFTLTERAKSISKYS